MNLIWFLVDSVRNYRTHIDDRDRLDVMDKIASESVEFSTVVTSAPSTLMAISSMMTGWPSIFLSRTYHGFKHDRIRYPSLGNILEDNGYHNYHIIFFPEGRDLLDELIYPIKQKYWPKGTKSSEFWTNDQVNLILKNIIKELTEPFFLYVHYNCRHDPETSIKVEWAIELFKKEGFFSNSVFILNSDHGYPDPQRQISFYKMREKGHDLILTDDNILVPLFIKYPESPITKIETPVSSLSISPTILEILGYEHPNYINSKFKGSTLLPLIRNEEKQSFSKMVRIDNRFIFQPNRKAAIRNHKYKYVYSWMKNDEFTEEFYDIETDKLEQFNLINSTDESIKKEIQKFRKEFEEFEIEVLNHQKEYIENKLVNIIKRYKKIRTLLFYADCHEIFTDIIIRSISINFPKVDLTVLSPTSNTKNNLLNKTRLSCTWINFNDISMKGGKIYDLAILPLTTKNDFFNRILVKKIKKLNLKSIYYTNYNLEQEPKPKNWVIAGIKWVYKQKGSFKDNPRTFLFDIVVNFKKIFSSFLSKKY